MDEEPANPAAWEALRNTLLAELRVLASRALEAERTTSTLSPTALTHEVLLRVGPSSKGLDQLRCRAYAATALRHVLVDHARRRRSVKRGGEWKQVTLSGLDLALPENDCEVLALDEALAELAALHERQHRIVELRFFAGLTHDEIAALLEVSVSTVEKDWKMARTFLKQLLSSPG